MKRSEVTYDVAVVGGGPAGMMAAGRAAELGAKVILIEKNESLGKKLLITGGGRCNLTNAEFDTRKFLEKFKDGGKFLFSAFLQFGVKESLEFFHMLGVKTKVENEQRVFPVSDNAQTVLVALLKYIKKHKVEIILNSPVVGILASEENEKEILGVKLKNGREILARKVIIATGGTSRPETGSTGDAYEWLRKIGHTVIESAPSLVPIAVKDDWVKKLAGLILSNIKITTFQNGAKQNTSRGKILFTHFGLSGPAILNMSKDIGELLNYGEVIISLDIFPSEDHGTLNAKLQELFKEQHNKKFKNSLSALMPSALASAIVDISKINPERQCNSITREERLSLLDLLKNIPIRADKLLGADKAIVSSGGVSLNEIDFKTMSSRLFPNLYLIGDVLNIDRPSGGYSLQLCWTTGFVAGNSAGKR
ncbi:MAG: NAD(P)/FAD-dependent oxidoreductase [Patescibacteria group bacterium]|nr:NAD(P)/FAD-dependent oxidoreductase [Patescibacteria group bacterium]MDE1988200.1 NAD(P)/FAD-dependent oxidoreductase [Patescibacteria group bacterium]MDE2218386.1 NAD(P)/FAD-dependent oxidoreductase [Patescibacteria group bacterium]